MREAGRIGSLNRNCNITAAREPLRGLFV